jgi:PAS domain S-box-containing protein
MTPPYTRSLRALYVEDNARDAKMYTRSLEAAGFAVSADVVCTREQFVMALRTGEYDIILADHGLPGWSGAGALDALIDERKQIPLIFVSGTVTDEFAVESVKMGATDYVLKDRLARLPHSVERAILERKARQERENAERSRDLLASLVESSYEAIMALDLDGKILTWNRGAARIFGYEPGEIVGRPFAALFSPQRAAEAGAAVETLGKGDTTSRYETQCVRKDGGAIEVAVTISPLREVSGLLSGASAIVQDITHYRLLEEQLRQNQKLESIGRLAGGIAHDFNNLLTVINGYSGLMVSRLQPHDRLYPEASHIARAGKEAAALTRQLLAFSRKQVLQSKPIDLNEVIRDALPMLSRLVGEDIELDNGLLDRPMPVLADPTQINQVLMNLAANARDAMPRGGRLTFRTGEIQLDAAFASAHPGVKPGPHVWLEVIDTGDGMSPEVRERIFEPFFTTKGRLEGTGLGLATVYGIVKQSGGTIWVKSEAGCGTSFNLYFPELAGPWKVQAPEATGAASPAPRVAATILLVEDQPDVRRFVVTVLEAHGYGVIEASNGNEAIALAGQHGARIDLLLSDVIMPGMSGVELAKQLRARAPSRRIPVIFVSGYTLDAIARGGILPADTALLDKPFTPEKLIAKIEEVLKQG